VAKRFELDRSDRTQPLCRRANNFCNTTYITVNRNLSIVRRERDNRLIVYSVYTAEENAIRNKHIFSLPYFETALAEGWRNRERSFPPLGVIQNAVGWVTRVRWVHSVRGDANV